jgi:N6-adenosine-specific RNA methylase IME4
LASEKAAAISTAASRITERMDLDLARLENRAQLTAAGLDLPLDLSFDDWLDVGCRLRELEGAIQWWIGDWLAYGERRYGEKYKLAAAATGYAYDTLNAARWVAQQVPFVRRRTNLSWSHHKEVAALGPTEQDRLLDAAHVEGWTRNELRRRAKVLRRANGAAASEELACSVADLGLLAERGRTFSTIYADPPWRYENQATRASTDNHYGTLSVEEIAGLPIRGLAADNAHLHLWTTNGFLFEARQVMEGWGFEYRSMFVWTKPQMGMGNYWRVAHEILLLGVRGSLPFSDQGQRSWQEWPRTDHSTKPSPLYEIIEAVSPGPYLELFARTQRNGWTSWGDALPRSSLQPTD